MVEPLGIGLGWLAIASVVGFVLMAFDKTMAIRRAARVPEKTLLGVAAIGGSIGVAFAMYGLHHKSRKRSFQVQFWTVVAMQVAILLVIFWPR